MTVRDYKGQEIKVGSRCLYGAPEPGESRHKYLCTVIHISDPDVIYNPVTDADDGGYEVLITIKFDDGGEEDNLHAPLVSVHGGPYDYDHQPEDEIFEETGDLEVLVTGPDDKHAVEVSEDGTWHFQDRQSDGSLRTFMTVTFTEIVTQSNDEQPSVQVNIRTFNNINARQTVEDAQLRIFF